LYLPDLEKFRTLYIDPGETAGWSLACGTTLLAAGQTPLWHFADDIWDALKRTPKGPLAHTPQADAHMHWDADESLMDLPIKRIVFENFRLYKKFAMALVGDEFRTVRLIGAFYWMARHHGIDIFDQNASIKELAEIGGAEAFFLRPLKENRHANDALRHWWYFAQFGPDGDEGRVVRGA
jgi:hypothetical protein